MTPHVLPPDDPRRVRPALRRIHNVTVVQSRKGWTRADVMQALADADKGIVYSLGR